MNTNERPTPETTSAIMESRGAWSFGLRHKMEQLERERDEAREELKATCKLLEDANRGAEWDAHINNSLAGKLNEAQKEIKAMREAIKDAHDALDDITTKLVGWHGLYENQVGKDDEEAFRKGDAALAKLQPFIQ